MPYTSRKRSRILATRARDGGLKAGALPRAGDLPDAVRAEWAGGVDRTGSRYRGTSPLYPRQVPEVSDHNEELDGLPVFWRSAPPPPGGPEEPVPLYLHGVPTNSDDWVEFLERTGGLAPDLPGFGRSGKPGSREYTIGEYADFLERFLQEADVERVSLVLHDWGAVGLAFAQRHPERVERLVLIDAVPFLPGFRWHRIARVWRAPILGELAMGMTYRRSLRLASKETNATPGPMSEAYLDSVLDHFDQGTQRAILRLYRSSSEEVLAAAGRELHELQMPALVVWGMKDPYVPARFARAYASVLENSELLELPDAGHVPWLDRPDVIDRVASFLGTTSG
jgi:pimeloyl-ACP methyl ester carboxylesterase